jgi:hypothetical protein
MTNVRATQPSSLFFRFFTIPFLVIVTLILDRPIAHAESPFGPAHSDEKSLPAPSAGAILTHGVATTPTQAQSGSVARVEGVLRQHYPVGQQQIDNPENRWHSLLPSGDQLILQLTIQRKDAQSTISLQNPLLLKAVL